MSREELALQTQLLLQEASHLSQGAAAATDAEASSLVEGNAPAVSELEAAKQALLDKLRRKKEQRRAQMQQVNQKRYGLGGGGASKKTDTSAVGPRLTPVKAKAAFKPPVAASTGAAAHKKKDMLARLRQQAIQQGSQKMAKFFGYASYEEQIKHLDTIEKQKILESEMKEKSKKQHERAKQEGEEEEEEEEEEKEHDQDDTDNGLDVTEPMQQDAEAESPHVERTVDLSTGADDVDEPMRPVSDRLPMAAASEGESTRVKRRNRIDEDEDDGNEADSEQDGDENDEARDDDDKMEMEGASDAATRSVADASASSNAAATSASSPVPKKDRAAAFRELLRTEALENRRRKRLVKGGGSANFVESEAEEDEEEDALKIGGLGDFGFGVPQAKTQESKEAEEERDALKLRADDLEGIVDDLSDDEQAQQQDLDEIFRKEIEDQDREQVKEVMRNVKEGFGRNRRAFSAGFHSGEARGRFNLDQLVAADGSKFEAARLGLLESDEEWSENETGKKKKRTRRPGRGEDEEDGEGEGDEEEGDEEEDEEAEMERMLRERYKNQPQIYVTSSESEDDEENAEDKGDAAAGADADELNSDEEREKQQMKLFSERARINRRMARMKDLQRQISVENGDDEGNKASAPVVPNLLLEEDEDSQELLKILNRTDVNSSASAAAATSTAPGNAKTVHNEGKRDAAGARLRPMLGRFNSFGASSSFHRVAGNCKLFNAGSGSGQASKGFVFTTALSSERLEQGDAAAHDEDELPPLALRPELGKSKSWSQSARRPSKRSADAAATGASKKKKTERASDLFSVLSSYQAVPSSSSNHSAPLSGRLLH